jgi:hypothetical protein
VGCFNSLKKSAQAFPNTGQQLTQYGHGVGLGDWDGDLDVFVGSLTGKPELWLNAR